MADPQLSERRRDGAVERWNRGALGGDRPPEGKADCEDPAAAGPRIAQNAASGEADVYIYGAISRWEISAKAFADQLAQITASTINVYINSPGGSVWEGLAILNVLRRHSATVRVIVDGVAASAASFIAMAGDEVVMSRNSQMMIHDGLVFVDIFAMANAADLDGMVAELAKLRDEIDRQSDNIAAIYAEAAGRRGGSNDAAQWRELMRAETWYFAAEAVKAGLADRVDGDAGDEDDDDASSAEDRQPDRFAVEQHFRYRSREDAPPPRAAAASVTEPPPAPPASPPTATYDLGAVFQNAVKEAAS